MHLTSVPARAQRSGGIFAVIVVFRVPPAETPSLQTLLMAAKNVTGNDLRLQITVVDNTPGGQPSGVLPPGVQYWARPNNPGLAGAYNEALRAAAREGFAWLLTLDQDTRLSADFLERMLQAKNQHENNDLVAAIVPHIHDGGRPISPFRFRGGFLPVVLPETASGVSGPHTSALNSGKGSVHARWV